MNFTLPELPYALDALNPHISRQTLEFHHGKHHLNYVNTLNTLIPGTRFEDASLEAMIREADGAIFNNAAQVWNHTFYFEGFSPKPKTEPTGALLQAIVRDFSSFDAFKEQFTKAALTQFGSGWAWLSQDKESKLVITKEPNAGNPLRHGNNPLLGLDVWEHAYYLDYQNRRVDHIAAVWDIINWKVVENRLK